MNAAMEPSLVPSSQPAHRGWRRRFLWTSFQAAGGLVLLGVMTGFIPILRFVREKIVVTLRPDEVRVEALYYYQNPWPFRMSQGMVVPFPVDATHPPPPDVALELLPGQDASLRRFYFAGQERFELYVGAGQTVCVRLRYSQYAPGRDGRYILTTTRPWRRALESGVYLMVLEGVALKTSSYPLQPREAGSLGFERKQFMPAQDWQFAWRAL
jgi:hypothetical protein